MPAIRSRPHEQRVDVSAGYATVTIAREHTLDEMKRAVAESVVKANGVPEGGEAWQFHVCSLLDSAVHIGSERST